MKYNKAREFMLLALASTDPKEAVAYLEKARAAEGREEMVAQLEAEAAQAYDEYVKANLDGPAPHLMHEQPGEDEPGYQDADKVSVSGAQDLHNDIGEPNDSLDDLDDLEDPEDEEVEVEKVTPPTQVDDVDKGDGSDDYTQDEASTDDPENHQMVKAPQEDQDEEQHGDPAFDNRGSQAIAALDDIDSDDDSLEEDEDDTDLDEDDFNDDPVDLQDEASVDEAHVEYDPELAMEEEPHSEEAANAKRAAMILRNLNALG